MDSKVNVAGAMDGEKPKPACSVRIVSKCAREIISENLNRSSSSLHFRFITHFQRIRKQEISARVFVPLAQNMKRTRWFPITPEIRTAWIKGRKIKTVPQNKKFFKENRWTCAIAGVGI